ncbi:MAG: class II aldolase/adducin family protein [Beutenbergiaceae bacterium]
MSSSAEQLARIAHLVDQRALTHGRTGNIAVRDGDQVLVTPTGVRLGQVRADQLARVDLHGQHLGGPKPTKETFLHVAILRTRPDLHAVVHTHSVYGAALSCLDGLDPHQPLPALTAYYGMRIGRLEVLPYYAPGDREATGAVEQAAALSHALLLRNHGPVVAGTDLDSALDALEELEHTAQLFFLTRALPVAPLTPQQQAALSPSLPPRSNP